MSDSLQPHRLQHTRPPCPSPTPGVYSNPCPSSRWCHPTISSSVVPFSSYAPSFPASGSFLMSRLFTSGGQSTGVSASASVLPMNIQDWFPLGHSDILIKTENWAGTYCGLNCTDVWRLPSLTPLQSLLCPAASSLNSYEVPAKSLCSRKHPVSSFWWWLQIRQDVSSWSPRALLLL